MISPGFIFPRVSSTCGIKGFSIGYVLLFALSTMMAMAKVSDSVDIECSDPPSPVHHTDPKQFVIDDHSLSL
jgi:hypothetical protein